MIDALADRNHGALGRFASALSPRANFEALREVVVQLWTFRALCMEMVRQDLSAQYAGQMLGLFWVLGHPLFLLGIYIFIFRFVFKVTVEITAAMPLNYTAYLLAGLVPWLSI